MARGGISTETTTRRCLWSGARGRKGLRSLSICCHGTFYGVLGGFYLFWRIRGQRVRSWCWVSNAAGFQGRRINTAGGQLGRPLPQPVTLTPRRRARDGGGGYTAPHGSGGAGLRLSWDSQQDVRWGPDQSKEKRQKTQGRRCADKNDLETTGAWECGDSEGTGWLRERSPSGALSLPCRDAHSPGSKAQAAQRRPGPPAGKWHLKQETWTATPGTHQGRRADDKTWKNVCTEGKLTKKQPQKENWVLEEAERKCATSDGCVDKTCRGHEEEWKRAWTWVLTSNCLVNQWWHVPSHLQILLSPEPAWPLV